jgi:Kef-type K+ transport system membrane component KefB
VSGDAHDAKARGLAGLAQVPVLLCALAAIAGLSAVAHELASRAPLDPSSAVATATAALGFLLMGGWVAGMIASRLGLPSLTGQLLAGIAAGPGVCEALGDAAVRLGLAQAPVIVSRGDITYLAGLDALAVSMIGLAAGGELELGALRSAARRVWAIIGIEMPVVGILTGAALAVLVLSGQVELGADVPLPLACAITGSLMMASSPAVAIALAREQGGGGSFAQLSLVVIVVKDIVLTLVFTAVVLLGTRFLVPGAEGAAAAEASTQGGVAATLAWHLLGSLAIGAAIALPLAYVLGRIERRMQMVALVIAAAIAALARSSELSPLLMSLAAGIALRAIAPQRVARFREAAGSILLPVCCVFFCLTGAKLDVQALSTILPATATLCAARLAAKWAGGTMGARVARLEPRQARWMWACLVPQAGVAIALAAEVKTAFPGTEWAVALSTLLVACVAMNEIVGPPLMRLALRRAQ